LWSKLAIGAFLVSPNAFVEAFTPSSQTAFVGTSSARSVDATFAINSLRKPASKSTTFLNAADDDDEEPAPFNPYANPDYPDLEFVNYDDPEYSVDQGGDEFVEKLDEDTTEEEIEAMREDRRRRNDEFQFETYHADCLMSGEAFKGEWTMYRASTFMEGVEEEEGATPRFKVEDPVRAVSVGRKIYLEGDENDFEFRIDQERLVHEERLAESHDFEEDEEWEAVKAAAEGKEGIDFVGKPYAPKEMSAFDFRGGTGSMCVGNCYTVSDAVPLTTEDSEGGPYAEFRSEIGIKYKRMRFRVKWDYKVKEGDESEVPALHLHSMIVCREMRERWPRYLSDQNIDESASEKLFSAPGAEGGLFDPPPVGGDVQASQYMSLPLEGGATVLFPHKIDQDPDAHDGMGWVQTLDWSPGRLRYQADKKIKSGKDLRVLRTLELSEIQAADVPEWRPNDSGTDMRQ
jgi:hypothetical protein